MMPGPVSKNPLGVVISIMGTWDEHHMSERASESPELTTGGGTGGRRVHMSENAECPEPMDVCMLFFLFESRSNGNNVLKQCSQMFPEAAG